jgi:LysM repeat protein
MMDIFGQEPALASDSEWLLQSGQASVESLAEILVCEHYRFVYQFAWMLAGEGRAARDCASQALAHAIRQAFRYPAGTSLRAWLAGFVLQDCGPLKKQALLVPPGGPPEDRLEQVFWQAVDSSKPAGRLAFVLSAFFEIPNAEVARICRQEYSDLEQSLDLIYAHLQTELQPILPDASPQQIDGWLKEFSDRRWPLPEISEPELGRLGRKVAALVLKQMSTQKRWSALLAMLGMGLALVAIIISAQSVETLLPPAATPSSALSVSIIPWSPKVYYMVQPGDSLESIARKTGVTPAELSSMNAISSTLDLYGGQQLSISVPAISELPAGLPGQTMTPTLGPPTLGPLTPDASQSQIREMLATSGRFWSSLWMDVQEAAGIHDPSSTDGMQYIRRQLWIQQPDRSYEVSNYLWGPAQMDYYRAIVLKGQGYYTFGSNSHFYWDEDWRIPSGNLLYNPYLDEMVRPGASSLVAAGRRYQVLGQSEIAGRITLMVDTWLTGDGFQRRIWIDAQTGVILRYQLRFPEQKGQKDFIVTAIAYNIPIPPALFDPRQPKAGGFAMDYSGWAPEPSLPRATDTPAFSQTPAAAP